MKKADREAIYQELEAAIDAAVKKFPDAHLFMERFKEVEYATGRIRHRLKWTPRRWETFFDRFCAEREEQRKERLRRYEENCCGTCGCERKNGRCPMCDGPEII